MLRNGAAERTPWELTMAGAKLLNVKADNAKDFLDNAHKAMKDKSKLGETKFNLNMKFSLDSKTKKIKTGTFTLQTTITRVHWAGPAKTKPDKANLDAINEIERLNKAHEEAHQDSYEKVFKKAKGELEKEMEGKTPKEAQELLGQMEDKLVEACEKLHKTGGMINVSDNGNGKISVTESAEGPGGCK